MKHYQSKILRMATVIIIGSVILAACAPAALGGTSRPPRPVQPQTMAPMATQPPAQTAPTSAVIPVTGSTQTSAQIDPLVFKQAVRKLWEDHVTWTRVYIIADLAGSPEADAAAQRLLQNQVDIGNAIKPFYGEAAGNQLTALLKTHILDAVDILAAAKAGDTAKLNTANTSWYDNANQIASFLSSANPNSWSLSDMQSMMKTHLDLTLSEATARLNKDWTGDVAAYDKVHAEILDMAGMLSQGIISQFPDQFK